MNRTVHYRSVDPIQNLKLRVRLTCRSGSNTDQHVVSEEHTDEGVQAERAGKRRGFGRLWKKGDREEQGENEAPPAEGGPEGASADKARNRRSVRGRFWKRGGGENETVKGLGGNDPTGAVGDAEGDEKDDAPEGQGREEDEEADRADVAGEPGQEQHRQTDKGKQSATGGNNLYGLETCVRDVGWQEKVFSSAEITAALEHTEELGLTSTRALRQSRTSPRKSQQLRHLANASLREQYRSTILADSRYAGEAFSNNRIFTYINADEYSDRNETDRTITTSQKENQNPLVMMMYTRPQHRNEVLKHQTMFVMADCGEVVETRERVEFPLVLVRSYPDGSFEMRPGFNRKDEDGNFIDDPYEFEDINGVQWEYTIENAARTDTTAEERRREQLTKQHNERARMLRKAVTNTTFQPTPGPSPDAMRFMLLAEIMAAKDFDRDQLWVQYELRFDPETWVAVLPDKPSPDNGVVVGATQVSRCTRYPGDPGTGQLPYYVAHFAQPIEAEFIAQQEPLPDQWPTIYFQINTYDNWDRYTVEGYTWFSLHSVSQGGCQVHRLPSWKPLGTVQDRLHSFFVGGSAELKDMSYSGIPQDFSGNFLSKFGFKAETSGTLKLRTMSVVQQRRPGPDPQQQHVTRSPGRAKGTRGLDTNRRREKLDLAKVVERARRRLEAARGGPVVVRGEALEAMADPPVIVKDTSPEEEETEEGGLAVFSVVAKGRAPLRYTWYFGAEKVPGDSGSQTLFVRDAQMSDAGEYSCVITNADGNIVSRKARLTVSPALGFAEQPGSYMERYEGQTVELAVEGKGKPPLSYQWFKGQAELDYDETCTSSTLVIVDVAETDAGFYHCQVSNEGGKERSEVIKLVILPDTEGIHHKKKLVAQEAGPGDQADADESGEKAESAIPGEDAEGAEKADGEPNEETGSVIEHNIEEEQAEDRAAGDAESAPEPSIAGHPRSVVVASGEPAEFRVSAQGEKPLSFQWLRDGRDMDGETDPELAIMQVEPRHAGSYTCRVSNAHGEVLSNSARLEVEAAVDYKGNEVEAFAEDDVEEFVAD